MNLPEPLPVREFERVDHKLFTEVIRPTGQPAVLRGIGADWPAVRAARSSDDEIIDYLRRLAVPAAVAVLIGEPSIKGRFFYTADVQGFNFTRGKSRIEPFFDRLLRDRVNPEPYAIAIQSEQIPVLFPGFEKENGTDLVQSDVVPRAWIGNRIQVALHYDLMENIGVVVAGRRRFTLFPPEQLPNLYPGPLELTPAGTPVSMVDPAEPDLDRFPRYAEAAKTAQSATLEPGDGIYIPFHWWHGVDSLEPVNFFVNYWWNDARAGLDSPYDALMHAMLALKPLPPEQRDVWRMIFDHYVFEQFGDPAEHLPPDARGVLGPMTSERLARMRASLKQILGKL